jgi:hypothetical protein
VDRVVTAVAIAGESSIHPLACLISPLSLASALGSTPSLWFRCCWIRIIPQKLHHLAGNASDYVFGTPNRRLLCRVNGFSPLLGRRTQSRSFLSMYKEDLNLSSDLGVPRHTVPSFNSGTAVVLERERSSKRLGNRPGDVHR